MKHLSPLKMNSKSCKYIKRKVCVYKIDKKQPLEPFTCFKTYLQNKPSFPL